MKTYANPTATVIRLDTMDVIATSGESNYIELNEVVKAARPGATAWGDLTERTGF